MKITTTTIQHISEQNKPFVPYIASKLKLDEETVNETIIRVLNEAHRQANILLILPYLEKYFGEKDKAMFDAIVEAMNTGALEVETTITE
jgi:hypothetical protein